MELRQMRFAMALAEELHFGRAAAREAIAAGSFSEQIQRLEREVGVQLFHRTSRRVSVTPAGAAVLEQMRRAVAAADEVRVVAARAARGETGRLSVGLAAAAIDFSPRVLRAFAGARPEVDLQVTQYPFLDPSAGLRGGEADVSLVWAPFDETGLSRRLLRVVPRVAVVPDDHRLAAAGKVSIEELLDDAWGGCPPADPVWTGFWLADEHRGGVPARIGGVAGSLEGLVELVAAGRAVMLAPAVVRSFAIPGVAYLDVPDVAPCEVSVAWVTGQDGPLVQAFVASAEAVADSV